MPDPNPQATPRPPGRPHGTSKAVNPATPKPGPAKPTRRRKWLWRIVLALVVLIFIGGGGLVGAELYTSRPQFCGTCHVMDKYYRSWSRDIHSYKLDVRCVDCHYAPGEQHTLHAKFKGLSQLASYFSGRYGQARPRAHVNDASCLRAPCHGDQKYLNKALLIGESKVEKRIVGNVETEVQRNPTVTFVHEKHLRIQAKSAETETQIDELLGRLLRSTTSDAHGQILAAAESVQPSAKRDADMLTLLKRLDLESLSTDALELMRLEHLRTRQQQLAGLNCAPATGMTTPARTTSSLPTCKPVSPATSTTRLSTVTPANASSAMSRPSGKSSSTTSL